MQIQILAGLAILTSISMATIVGIRLLLLFSRSRQTPELLLGSMLFVGMGCGFGLMLVASRLEDHSRLLGKLETRSRDFQ